MRLAGAKSFEREEDRKKPVGDCGGCEEGVVDSELMARLRRLEEGEVEDVREEEE